MLADVAVRRWAAVGVVVAAGVVLARDVQLVRTARNARLADRAALQALFADPRVAGQPAEAFYFVGLPEHNRQHGSLALAHDEWLYGAFESVSAAEPRELWLRPALTEGRVRQVVVPDDSGRVTGVAAPLPQLGFARIGQFGPYRLWQRLDGARLATRGLNP